MKMKARQWAHYHSFTVSHAVIMSYYHAAKMRGRFRFKQGHYIQANGSVLARLKRLYRPMRGWRSKHIAWGLCMEKQAYERGFRDMSEEYDYS